jgi:hypothetical protein
MDTFKAVIIAGIIGACVVGYAIIGMVNSISGIAAH